MLWQNGSFIMLLKKKKNNIPSRILKKYSNFSYQFYKTKITKLSKISGILSLSRRKDKRPRL